ncbi:MAG: pyridoxamine 5'-phosphate oxidase [Rhodothermales bacterium]|nr:pyridoxamine 5'-phosphate oxidase [Rhodothermales bacterium]
MTLLRKIRSILTLGRGVTVGMRDVSETEDPVALFENWFEAAKKAGAYLPEALSLSTSSSGGRPSSRMVLLKDYDQRGFVFFTNYESRKAGDLKDNPEAAMLFHWAFLQRQVRIEGRVERVSREESEAYFRSRPRGSRIGAWASKQSRPLASRDELERRVAETEQRFKGTEIPLPDFWGGYRVIPRRIEFWQGRLYRLHDRIVFTRTEEGWATERLFP